MHMLGVLQTSIEAVGTLTLKELTIMYDSRLLATWDHTAQMTAMIYNIGVIVGGFAGKSKLKAKASIDFHPYRSNTRQRGMKLTKENFNSLKDIGRALCKR